MGKKCAFGRLLILSKSIAHRRYGSFYNVSLYRINHNDYRSSLLKDTLLGACVVRSNAAKSKDIFYIVSCLMFRSRHDNVVGGLFFLAFSIRIDIEIIG